MEGSPLDGQLGQLGGKSRDEDTLRVPVLPEPTRSSRFASLRQVPRPHPRHDVSPPLLGPRSLRGANLAIHVWLGSAPDGEGGSRTYSGKWPGKAIDRAPKWREIGSAAWTSS